MNEVFFLSFKGNLIFLKNALSDILITSRLLLGVLQCLQIQTLLYGPQDKRTLATQQTMDILSK